MQDEQSFRDYTVRVYRNEYGAFEIWRSGQRIYVQTGFRFRVGNFLEDANECVDCDLQAYLTPLPMGLDVTGGGAPQRPPSWASKFLPIFVAARPRI